MPTLQLSNELTIHFYDLQSAGSPTVVLLHGLGVNSQSWGMQTPALERAGFRVLIPDMRSFGKSSYPGGRVSLRDLAGDMTQVLAATGVCAAAVVGISMGGCVALQMAIDEPQLVTKLVLINTFSRLRPRNVGALFYYATRLFLAHAIGVKTQARAVAHHLFPGAGDEALRALFIDQISQADPAGYRATMRALARFDVTQRLPGIQIPTLVITGEQDTTVPIEIQNELASRIPNAQHKTIPGAGHAVTIEKPNEINHILIEFINANSRDVGSPPPTLLIFDRFFAIVSI